ncbi:GNAT family N-acetyltransferase [Clostridium paridis]|uniref:GNAT family N-acetyltransferase n=1 Tax=Clostridium paridis TaxID=2803863 RepID=A0A937FE73_9CLOT|nr:GNAT family N-acetyltransferase [Clostridium paridis]MBL4932199.1 GNAT family N-acetyltransferase [Clostridium paridis]
MESNFYRRDGKLVYIKQPEFSELKYVQTLWKDRETMDGIGGIYHFPEEKWKVFYHKMVMPSDGKNFYCLVYNLDEVPVGEVSFHGYDSAAKIARFNIKIQGKYRKRGYGREAIRLLLEYYFFEFGGNIMMEKAKQEFSNEFISSLGFEVIRKDKGEITYQISKETFKALSNNEKKNVCCILYPGVDLLEVSFTFELFNLINKFNGEEVFKLYVIGDDEVDLSNGMKIIPSHSYEAPIIPNIIIMPGGCGCLENNKISSYIDKFYKDSDYILATGHGIMTIAKCGIVKNHIIAALEEDRKQILNMSPSSKIAELSYVDTGKIITTVGGKSSIEGTLKIIDNILGNEKTKDLKEYLSIHKK